MKSFQQYIENYPGQPGATSGRANPVGATPQQMPQQMPQAPPQQQPNGPQVSGQPGETSGKTPASDPATAIAGETDRFGMALQKMGVDPNAIRPEMEALIAKIDQIISMK